MKIWKQFKTLSAALPSLNSRRCWQTCNNCKKVWSETKTEFVSMVVSADNETRFVCDGCIN